MVRVMLIGILIAIAFPFPLVESQSVAEPPQSRLERGRLPPDVSVAQAVRSQRCYGGLLTVEDRVETAQVITLVGSLTSQVASSEGHPNAEPVSPDGRLRVAMDPRNRSALHVGSTYAVIVKRARIHWTLVAYGPDNTAALAEIKALLQSPAAFQNDETWRQRRLLWVAFRRDVAVTPTLYCEDDTFTRLMYVARIEGRRQVFIYRLDQRETKEFLSPPRSILTTTLFGTSAIIPSPMASTNCRAARRISGESVGTSWTKAPVTTSGSWPKGPQTIPNSPRSWCSHLATPHTARYVRRRSRPTSAKKK